MPSLEVRMDDMRAVMDAGARQGSCRLVHAAIG
jgi:hypothetical protein